MNGIQLKLMRQNIGGAGIEPALDIIKQIYSLPFAHRTYRLKVEGKGFEPLMP